MFLPSQNATYCYPDGTVSVTEPADNQIFYIWDVNATYPREVWQWSTKRKQWLKLTPQYGSQNKLVEDDLNLVQEFERLVKESVKCECGSEAVGSSQHSSWCQKWSADS